MASSPAPARASAERTPKADRAPDLSWRQSYEFDVFISYSRRDAIFARRLDSALRFYAAPADLDPERKTLRIFRDEQDLTGVEYGHAIESPLERSAKLLIICSPAARASAYVDDEIRRFRLAHKSRDLVSEQALIPVLLEGVPNNETTEETRSSGAFPEALCSEGSVPLAADYRGIAAGRQRLDRAPYENDWYKLLANIYGTAQAVIEEREKHRQARRRRLVVAVLSAALAVVSGLLVFATISRHAAVVARALAEKSATGERIASAMAQQKQKEAEKAAEEARRAQQSEKQQKEEAQRQRNIAVARQLAAQSEQLRNAEPGLIDRSLLLAVESMKRVPLFENDGALRQALQLLPAAVNTEFPALTAVAFSPNSESAAVTGGGDLVHVVDLPSGKQQRTIRARSAVFSLEFTPDGRLVAGCAGSLLVFNPETGDEIAHVDRLGNVHSIAISRDGRFLATGSDDKTARVFRTDTWVATWEVCRPEPVRRVIISPDGRYLLSEWGVSRPAPVRIFVFSPDGRYLQSEDTRAQLFDLVTGKEVPADVFRGEPAALGANGVYATLSSSGVVTLVSAESGKELGPLSGDTVRAIAFSPDGDRVVACSGMPGRDKTCRVFKPSSPHEPLLELPAHQEVVAAIGFSPDGELLATTSRDGTVRVFKTETGGEVARIPKQEVSPAVFSADSNYLVTAGGTQGARIYQLSSDEILRMPNEGNVTTIALSADGRYVAHAGHVALAEVPDGDEPLSEIELGSASAVALSRDGQHLAISGSAQPGRARPLLVLNIANKQTIFRANPRWPVQALAFSADGKRLAVGEACRPQRSADLQEVRPGTAWVVDLSSRKVVLPAGNCPTDIGVVRALEFSRDGKYLAIGSEKKNPSEPRDSGMAQVVRLQSGERVFSVAHRTNVHAVAFSPDGRYFASGSLDNEVLVTDMRGSGRIALPHPQTKFAIAFSSDSRLVATGGYDGTVRVFDLFSRREVSRVTAGDRVRGLLFSSDGRFLTAAAGNTGDVVVSRHLLRPEDLAGEACRHVGRNLSQIEWHQYVGEEAYRKTCAALH